jgi:hypothetical protein
MDSDYWLATLYRSTHLAVAWRGEAIATGEEAQQQDRFFNVLLQQVDVVEIVHTAQTGTGIAQTACLDAWALLVSC